MTGAISSQKLSQKIDPFNDLCNFLCRIVKSFVFISLPLSVRLRKTHTRMVRYL